MFIQHFKNLPLCGAPCPTSKMDFGRTVQPLHYCESVALY